MPVAGQPAQIRQIDRRQCPESLIAPADPAAKDLGCLENVLVGWLHPGVGADIEHNSGPVATADEVIRDVGMLGE